MMKKYLLIIFLLLFSTLEIQAQFNNAQLVGENSIRSIDTDDQGNLIFISLNFPHVYITKTDPDNQNVLWKFKLPDSAGYCQLKVFMNEIYCIVNYAYSNRFFKLSSNGNLAWSKKITSVATLFIDAIGITGQKRTYLGSGACGYSNSITALDSSGNYLWTKKYNYPPMPGTIASIIEDNDSNLFVLSNTIELTTNHRFLILFKLSIDGNVLWTRFYEAPFYSSSLLEIPILKTDSKKNIYITCNIVDSAFQHFYNVLVKTDSLGYLQWCKYYPHQVSTLNASYGFDIARDDNLYLFNYYYSNADSSANFILRINTDNGSIKSALSDSGLTVNRCVFRGIKSVNPNKFILTSERATANITSMDSLGNGLCYLTPADVNAYPFLFLDQPSYYLATVSDSFYIENSSFNLVPSGSTMIPYCSTVATESADHVPGISVYPNPTRNRIVIESQSSISYLEWFDVTGKLLRNETVNSSRFETDISRFNNGIYFITLQAKDRVIHNKIIKQ